MSDLEKRIREILDTPRTAALATISESGAPWVRYVTIRAERDLTLSLCTALSSRKAREIAADPRVHLTCGELRPPNDSVFLQIAGRAEVCKDADTKARYWQEEWRRYFTGPDDPDYVIILVRPDRIECNGPGSIAPDVWAKERR
jgi:general stress protein 26